METDEIFELIDTQPLGKVLSVFPGAADFLNNCGLHDLDRVLNLYDSFEKLGRRADDCGYTAESCASALAHYIAALYSVPHEREFHVLEICPGFDKSGMAETCGLSLAPGGIVSLVGPTGSGKSRLLGDIECFAQGDTPSNRRIRLNGRFPDEEERTALSASLVALLSQNMNFVVDMSAADFLRMHARGRKRPDVGMLAEKCLEYANSLSGEGFGPETKLAQLSGGQTRALMIADTALISNAPVILIDEIENAGINRGKAVSILAGEGKAVIISTHDPLLALGAARRVVMKNGAISKVIVPGAEEKSLLEEMRDMDRRLNELRGRIRAGEVF